jgi:S-adenosylmethionine decarboxylase
MFLIALITMIGSCLFGEDYNFRGKHFIASYLNCNRASIGNVDRLILAMDEAVKASGATVLDKSHYVFEPNGLTIVYLLSESHASLHTYPEHGTCFVDLFTCGEKCSAERFNETLKNYLEPDQVNARFFLRDHTTQELPF